MLSRTKVLQFLQGWVYYFISLPLIEISAWLTLSDAEDKNGGTLSSYFPLDFFVTVLLLVFADGAVRGMNPVISILQSSSIFS